MKCVQIEHASGIQFVRALHQVAARAPHKPPANQFSGRRGPRALIHCKQARQCFLRTRSSPAVSVCWQLAPNSSSQLHVRLPASGCQIWHRLVVAIMIVVYPLRARARAFRRTRVECIISKWARLENPHHQKGTKRLSRFRWRRQTLAL